MFALITMFNNSPRILQLHLQCGLSIYSRTLRRLVYQFKLFELSVKFILKAYTFNLIYFEYFFRKLKDVNECKSTSRTHNCDLGSTNCVNTDGMD